MQSLIVFGSAVGSETPNDIDVACEGALNALDLARIGSWVRERRIRPCASIDAHQIISNGVARIPAPCGIRGDYAILPGSCVTVAHTDYWSIPAILRAFGRDAERASQAWNNHTLYGRMIDIGPADDGVHGGDWTNYVTGMAALRSAIAKAPMWRQILDRVPEGALLCSLAEYGASAAGIRWAMRSSSGAGARLLFVDKGVTTQYGDEILPYGADTIDFLCG